jgi:hypothetical protein
MPMYKARRVELSGVVAEQEFEATDDEMAINECEVDPLRLAREGKTVYWVEVTHVRPVQ